MQMLRLFRMLQLLKLFKEFEMRQRVRKASENAAPSATPEQLLAMKYEYSQSRVGQRLSGEPQPPCITCLIDQCAICDVLSTSLIMNTNMDLRCVMLAAL